MPWYDELIPAKLSSSVGSVDFHVRSTGKTGGRRTQAHEFADVNGAWVEDSGGMPQRYQVKAFLVGDEYHVALQQLEEILESPGPVEYDNPFRGTISNLAIEGEYTTEEDTGKLGFASVSFTLVQDGQPEPLIFESLSNLAVARAGAVFLAARSEFEATYSGQDPFGAATRFLGRVSSELADAYADVRSKFGPIAQIRNAVSSFTQRVSALASLPLAIVSDLYAVERALNTATARQSVNLSRAATGYGNPIKVLTDSAEAVAGANATDAAASDKSAAVAGGGAVAAIAQADLDALQVLATAAALAALTETLPIIELPTGDAAQELSDFIAGFADEILALSVGGNPISSDLYDAVLQLRQDVVELLGQLRDELPPIVSHTVPSTVTMIDVAHALSGATGRNLSDVVRELIAVNGELDPVFVVSGSVVKAVLA